MSDGAALRVYAPRGLLAGRDGRALHAATAWDGHGSVLLADLCGFTRLTARLAGSGRAGAEEVTSFLDRSFGPLVDEISRRGGDSVAFAGDSLLAVWDDTADTPDRLALRASLCALDLLKGHEKLRSSGLFLPLRISIGSGALRRLELGGESGRWVHFAAGEAIEEVLRVDALRLGGQLSLGPAASKHLRPALIGEDFGSHFAVTALARHAEDLRAPREAADPAVPPEGFVPEAVIERLGAGIPEFVAEFRNVTSAFFAFDPLLAHDLMRIQEVVLTAQRCIRRFEGTLHQVIQDDKGVTLIGTFGVPPRSHDDDPVRGVECASELMDHLGRLGVRTRAAVSTGLVYCGDYGGVTRRQYGVVGESMNRAAHLMAHAEAGAVVCDAATQDRARRHRQFVALPGQQLKGGEEIRPFLTGASWSEAQHPPLAPELVGRTALRRDLAVWLERLCDSSDHPPLLVIEGEAGIGKTTVLSYLQQRARDAGVDVVWSQGEAIRARSSYVSVRPLVRALGARREPLPGAAGLLNAVLPEVFDPDPAVEGLAPQTRLEELIELLRKWAVASTRERPLLWIVEDGHWVDSASQSVIGTLSGVVPRLGVAIGRRPFPGAETSLRPTSRETLTLEPLERSEIDAVLRARLRVASIPEPLVDVIHRRAAGNPLYAEELAGVLLEHGDVEVVERECRVRSSVREIERVAAPPSLERLITTRVDRLEPLDQLVLKAASVLGRSFELALLRRVCVDSEVPSLDARIERLVAAGFFNSPAPDASLAFRHPLFQEITYGLLVAAQRRLLHRRAAEALDGVPEDQRARSLARLALHWEQAGDASRALPLLTRAADDALRSYANEESIDLYGRALAARSAVGDEVVDALEIARVERNIGAAHASLTRHVQAREHYHRSIEACGYPVSRARGSAARELAINLLHRTRRALMGRGARALRGEERARALAAITSMGGLAPVELWLGDERGYALLALQIANLGDRLEPSAMSAGSATGLGYLLGLTPLRRLAESELRRGLAGAIETPDAELRIMCGVLLGMFLTATGRPLEAIETLRPASDAGAVLMAGPWRHRSRFMLAEALLLRGEFAEAVTRFDEAAELARHGEPHVVGFANSLGALARLHLGKDREALALLLGDDGVEGTRRNESRLPLFAGLGALAEVSALSGKEPERGAAAAREAESLAGDWSDTASYFAGFFGHAGMLEWWVDQLERGDASAESHVARALRRLHRFARRYPAAWPRLRLLEARHLAAIGKTSRSRRALRASAALSKRFGLARELSEVERRLAAMGRTPTR